MEDRNNHELVSGADNVFLLPELTNLCEGSFSIQNHQIQVSETEHPATVPSKARNFIYFFYKILFIWE